MTPATAAPHTRPRPRREPLSAHCFDTTPGSHSALAPPADFAGDQGQYLAVIRRRYREDHEARQCILLAALRARQPFGSSALTFLGPYAAWARHVVATAATTFRAPHPGP